MWVDILAHKQFPQDATGKKVSRQELMLDKHLESKLEHLGRISGKAKELTQVITKIDEIREMTELEEAEKRTSLQKRMEYSLALGKMSGKQIYKSPGRSSIEGGSHFRSKISKITRRQDLIEEHVIESLPEQYKQARLIEITENSYLISNDVRLPVFGRALKMFHRDKSQLMNSGP